MGELSAELNGQLTLLVSLFVFRLQPFVLFACAGRSVPLRGRLLALAGYGGFAALGLRLGADPFGIAAAWLALGYFALLVPVVRGARDYLRAGLLDRTGLFLLCMLGFMTFPALVAPPAYVATVLILGWDLMLSAFSYCVDTERGARDDSLGECAFFLLVNPTLVYQERGRRVGPPALRPKALLRVTLGIAGLAMRCVLAVQFAGLIASGPPDAPFSWSGYQHAVTYYGLLGIGVYITHSGVASLQIGLMGLIGYEVPERYHWPLLATSPVDFWRRWNIWVGHWVQRYVFYPANLSLRRRMRAWPDCSRAIACLLAFGFMGVLHDAYTYATRLNRPDRATLELTLAFALCAAALLVWVFLRDTALRPLVPLSTRWAIVRHGSAVAAWLALVHTLMACAWLTRALMSDGLPALVQLVRAARLVA